jgi:hypothetical protein
LMHTADGRFKGMPTFRVPQIGREPPDRRRSEFDPLQSSAFPDSSRSTFAHSHVRRELAA